MRMKTIDPRNSVLARPSHLKTELPTKITHYTATENTPPSLSLDLDQMPQIVARMMVRRQRQMKQLRTSKTAPLKPSTHLVC
jgi:hypothetical protein